MKTEKREVAPRWVMPTKENGLERPIAFAARQYDAVVFGSFEDVVEFAAKSAAHGEAVKDLLNGQLNIRFGSDTARAAIENAIGQQATPENAAEARAKWEGERFTLDLVAAFGQQVEKPSGRGKVALVEFATVKERLMAGTLSQAAQDKLGVTTVAELEARYKPAGTVLSIDDL